MSVAALVSRGPAAEEGALEVLLAAVDPAALASPAPSPLAACPGEGAVTAGALVVPRRGGCGLVQGAVHTVASVQGGLCTLLAGGGSLVEDGEGKALLVPTGDLALAGAPLEATPLHLALLLRCPWEVVSALVARAPEALSKLDALGRSPLAVAAEVSSKLEPFFAEALHAVRSRSPGESHGRFRARRDGRRCSDERGALSPQLTPRFGLGPTETPNPSPS